MFNFIKNHKVISLVAFLNVVLILVVILIIVMHNAKTAVIDIYVAPVEANITINGKNYENFNSYDVMPGDYHAVIAMEGMQTKEVDFTLEDDGMYHLWEYLLDENGGFDYYLTRQNDELALAKVANDDAAKKFVAEYEKVAEITNILPIQYDAYTDNYAYYIRYKIIQDMREDCDRIVCLIIEDNTGGNEQRAKDKIKEEGYNPSDYDITYEFVPLYESEMNNG